MKRRFPAPAPARRPSVRRVSAALAGVALAAVTAGCELNSPLQTQASYQPADGISANVGNLALRDLALIGNGDGTVVVNGSAYNSGQQDVTVQISAQGDPNAATPPTGSELQVGPSQQVTLESKGLQLNQVSAKPGRLVPVKITASTGGTVVVKVPVLAPTDYYSTVTPAPTGS
ncbi:hypothetical protein [Terrabacter sp. NPDC080008]|uniref:hypothetical protein n=1 Tax=Terrabacter sp. NPDC080008 TaxID=3155176 RepID=UPI00344CFA43